MEKRTVGRGLFIVVLGIVCGPRPAHAQRRDFPITSDWLQAGAGQDSTGEQGSDDRIAVAPSVAYQNDTIQGFRYQSVNLASRCQLGDFATGRWLPGATFGLDKPRAQIAGASGKLIISRFDSHGGDFSVNFNVAQTFTSGAGIRRTDSLGYARPVGRSKCDFRGGFECLRNVNNGRASLGPVLGWNAGDNIHCVGGYDLPLYSRGAHGGVVRLIAEYEAF